ncbi:hypothetical protein CWB73_20535 [Pseudoalteromonas phenolica]|uniref:Uncharacterized protein n=1 Tax=Pseudoalteromonas phenolica TaxID=161398 RepID=A0A5S3YNX2_9GAMM|nr:hypothetical protein [Pseudoalteromonas phenolica]TMP77227.1 hypothetical protein CWB73_20535 [Pseudoalteromonas phenolica]
MLKFLGSFAILFSSLGLINMIMGNKLEVWNPTYYVIVCVCSFISGFILYKQGINIKKHPEAAWSYRARGWLLIIGVTVFSHLMFEASLHSSL